MSSDLIKTLQETVKQSLKLIIYASLVMIIVIPSLVDSRIQLGRLFGILAVFAFATTQLPGLIRRFGLGGIFRDIYKILLPSRAQQGIAMFLFGLIHYLAVYLFPIAIPIAQAGLTPQFAGYSMSGLVSLFITLLLFLTSNTQSKKWLKKNWNRLHSLVYVLSWTIALHLVFIFQYQTNLYGKTELSTMLLAGGVIILGILQITSILYARYRKRESKLTIES